MTIPREKWSTAIHESGHAVVAHSFGWPLAYVSIVPSSDNAGLTKVRSSVKGAKVHQVSAYVMGGLEAQRMIGAASWADSAAGAKGDFDVLAEMVHNKLPQIRKWAGLGMAEAERILIPRRSQVVRLAKRLCRDGYLSGGQVSAILTPPMSTVCIIVTKRKQNGVLPCLQSSNDSRPRTKSAKTMRVGPMRSSWAA